MAFIVGATFLTVAGVILLLASRRTAADTAESTPVDAAAVSQADAAEAVAL
jgi:hypothetical protein